MREMAFNGSSDDGGWGNIGPALQANIPKGDDSIPTKNECALRKMIKNVEVEGLITLRHEACWLDAGIR